jgi:predicted alpha/beta-fold hydrolase
LIYVGGILTPKDHNITKWQVDELIDPAGQYNFRLAFVNLRGQHGNPMTSARLFDPHYDNEDFAVVVSYLHNKLPESPIIAHSFSFGGPVVAR